MRHLRLLLTVGALIFSTFAFAAKPDSQVGSLQRILSNAGYYAGAVDGGWNASTRASLTSFITDYGIAAPTLAPVPTSDQVAGTIAAAQQAIEAAHSAYPTQPLPSGYFVGLASQWYFNINNWNAGPGAATRRDGKLVYVPITRYFQPIDDDITAFQAAGVRVMRMQIGMDGTLFYDKCNYKLERDVGVLDACYSKAYAEAKLEHWSREIAMLDHLADNPVVAAYIDAIDYWNRNGFHVMIVPSDFYTGNGSHFDGSDPKGKEKDPLFHAALVGDPDFQKFFPQFVAELIAQAKARHLTNISLQSANEPRFCNTDGKPSHGGLKAWTEIEASEFAAARRVAPRLSLVSTAICTAGVQFFSSGRPYSEVGQVLPAHPELDDVTYALHLYSPRAIMIASAQNAKYRAGTVIHYPYQALPASAATNQEARFDLQIYSQVRPSAATFSKAFADLGSFAKSRSIRLMFTELNAPKPNFGLPREDRIRLVRDLIADSKENDIPIIYFGMLNAWGLSSCMHIRSIPDHRFDSALMNLIAFGNDVTGSDPNAPIGSIDAQCAFN